MPTNNNNIYITTATPDDNGVWERKLRDALFNSSKLYHTGGLISTYRYPKVKKVIYNFKNMDKPATIVFWDDGTKTVVKCEDEIFNREAGLAQCYLKKILGSRGNIQKIIENADIQE